MFTLIQVGVLCKWTNDSKRFLLEHFDTICDSPSHIYHSALPLSPSSSWLHEYYSAELSQKIRVVKGLPARWGTYSHTALLDGYTLDLSCWDDKLVVGTENGDIIVLDVITGSPIDTLSGHTAIVNSLTFSSDGRSLISGSDDCTAKLWDMQTGGAVKTFSGHTERVWSISISPDFTTVASGSEDKTTRLWNSQTGECYHVIEQQGIVCHVRFSSTHPQYLLSVCNNKVWQWDINGHKVGPTYDGSYVAFSSDGTQFAIFNWIVVTVRNTSSGVVVAKFQAADNDGCCCFSPDGRLIAIAAGTIAYVWDITSSEPHLIETFTGHTREITSITFSSPSSLISASYDLSVNFWQISIPSDPVEADLKSTSLTSAAVRTITLQSKDGIAITSDLDGVIRTWDISTGCCMGSFESPVRGFYQGDIQLINGKLIFVWDAYEKIDIWDVEKGELLLAVDRPDGLVDLRISGDGSRIFSLDGNFIQALSIQTGEVISRVKVDGDFYGSLTVDGLRVWVQYHNSEYHGWDFGTPDSLPVQWSNMPTLCLNDTLLWEVGQPFIRDMATGKMVFNLSGRFANPIDVQCDGYFLAAGYTTGEVLIIDMSRLLH